MSAVAKDFIDRLLTLEPILRITANEGIRHPWVTILRGESPSNQLKTKPFAAGMNQTSSPAGRLFAADEIESDGNIGYSTYRVPSSCRRGRSYSMKERTLAKDVDDEIDSLLVS